MISYPTLDIHHCYQGETGETGETGVGNEIHSSKFIGILVSQGIDEDHEDDITNVTVTPDKSTSREQNS